MTNAESPFYQSPPIDESGPGSTGAEVRPVRQGKTAETRVTRNTPITPPAPSDVKRKRTFAARAERGSTVATEERVASQDGAGTVQHQRPGTTYMYKPSESHGWIPRAVSNSAVGLLLDQGWSDQCPDCGGEHIDSQGRVSTDPNLCNAREPVAVRVCPVCRKRLYDDMAMRAVTLGQDAEGYDPNVLANEEYASATPAERTKLKLDLHLWVKHPNWAQANGVAQLPAAFKEIVEGALGPQSRGT